MSQENEKKELPPPSQLPPPSKLPPPDLAQQPSSPPPPDLSPLPSEPPPSSSAEDEPPGPPPEEANIVVAAASSGEEEEGGELTNGALAPVNTRLIAGVIDVLVAMALYAVVLIIMPEILHRLGWLVWAAYLLTRDSLPFLKGQSVGKMAMKLKAVKKDGGALTGDWTTGAIRNVPLIIPFMGLVELIVLFSREGKPEKGLRLGDEWAKTKVVVDRSGEEVPS